MHTLSSDPALQVYRFIFSSFFSVLNLASQENVWLLMTAEGIVSTVES